jgi:hypothetical protein
MSPTLGASSHGNTGSLWGTSQKDGGKKLPLWQYQKRKEEGRIHVL